MRMHVLQLLDANLQQEREKVERLTLLLKTIELCDRQNLPLRGHLEDGFALDPSVELQQNPGNFLVPLLFQEGAGDESVVRNFQKASNAGDQAIK